VDSPALVPNRSIWSLGQLNLVDFPSPVKVMSILLIHPVLSSHPSAKCQSELMEMVLKIAEDLISRRTMFMPRMATLPREVQDHKEHDSLHQDHAPGPSTKIPSTSRSYPLLMVQSRSENEHLACPLSLHPTRTRALISDQIKHDSLPGHQTHYYLLTQARMRAPPDLAALQAQGPMKSMSDSSRCVRNMKLSAKPERRVYGTGTLG
jgi:hypothetical protein